MQRQRRLAIGIEVGSVHRDDDFLALTDHLPHPVGKNLPHDDALIAQQTLQLLDGVLGKNLSANWVAVGVVRGVIVHGEGTRAG